MSNMWEPLIPPQPPWTLGGHWKIGECSKCLCLRHWKHMGIVFSRDEPPGGEVFIGRVFWDSQGWYVLGAFGSKQPDVGRLSIGASTASIKWPTGATWAQEQEEWEPPLAFGQRQARMAFVALLVVLAPCAVLEVYRLVLASALIGCLSAVHAVLALRVMPWWSTLALPGAKGLYLWICCVFAVSSLMALNAAAAAWLALNCWPPTVGRLYLACMTLTTLCSLLYGSWARAMESWANAQNPEEWAGVMKIPFSHAEHARVVQAFESACNKFQHLYPFCLEVTEVFSISNLVLEARFAESHGRMASEPNVVQLFHGTSAVAAKAIIAGGFRVSPLGRGLSFSETPLKGWQYTARTGGSYLLVCDVAMGPARRMPEEPALLSREGLRSALGGSDGDSLLLLRHEDGGSLRLASHRVLRPERALPAFLLRVRERHAEPS